jgi:hypothetical protein
MLDERAGQFIGDSGFITDVRRLGRLRAFLYKQALTVDYPPTPLSFAALSELQWRPNGRSPTEAERVTVDTQTEVIFRRLSEPLRRKFLMGELPWWLTLLPIAFVCLAVIALVFSIQGVAKAPPQERFSIVRAIQGHPEEPTTATRDVPPPQSAQGTAPSPSTAPPPAPSASAPPAPLGARVLPYYLLWLMALGATGAVAFIGMNVLSVQDDATFDLTNSRLMVLRIITGALFGLVLTLPFGFGEYILFCVALLGGVAGQEPNLTKQAALLLLPFVLGFSTSLVIMLLNQFIEAVQTFFGKKPSAVAAAAPAESSNPKAP